MCPKSECESIRWLPQQQLQAATSKPTTQQAATRVVSCDLHHRRLTQVIDGWHICQLISCFYQNGCCHKTKGDNFVAVSTRFNRFKRRNSRRSSLPQNQQQQQHQWKKKKKTKQCWPILSLDPAVIVQYLANKHLHFACCSQLFLAVAVAATATAFPATGDSVYIYRH